MTPDEIRRLTIIGLVITILGIALTVILSASEGKILHEILEGVERLIRSSGDDSSDTINPDTSGVSDDTPNRPIDTDSTDLVDSDSSSSDRSLRKPGRIDAWLYDRGPRGSSQHSPENLDTRSDTLPTLRRDTVTLSDSLLRALRQPRRIKWHYEKQPQSH